MDGASIVGLPATRQGAAADTALLHFDWDMVVSGRCYGVLGCARSAGRRALRPARQAAMPETLLGSRVRLEYDDQNESFSRYLPVEGTISHRCVAAT